MKPLKELDSCFRRNDDLPGFGKNSKASLSCSLARFYHSVQEKTNGRGFLKICFPSDAAVRFTAAISTVASAVRL
jgi:hypothetical protein